MPEAKKRNSGHDISERRGGQSESSFVAICCVLCSMLPTHAHARSLLCICLTQYATVLTDRHSEVVDISPD